MRFAEYRKAIKFKIRFKAVAEEVQPTILCRICELFAVLRALMLESELVLTQPLPRQLGSAGSKLRPFSAPVFVRDCNAFQC